MSRPTIGGSTTARRPADDNDVCPVCKSSRYLNPNMRFLVNSDCYHKMCESCVDRIFSHGPAQCPIAGCHRTLRKNRFRKQTFEDVGIEREVDIRRRVAAIFNRREDDFESLQDYNDYLNDVEDLTFNLVQGLDIEATEAKLKAYKEKNRQAIMENAGRAERESLTGEARRAAEREHARVMREAARREEEEEKREREQARLETLERLAKGQDGDAEEIIRKGLNKVTLKKSSLRKGASNTATAATQLSSEVPSTAIDGLQFRGLKKKVVVAADKEYDPFGGYSDRKDYFTLQDDYEWQLLDRAKADIRHTAGGYDILSYCERALCDAFTGFGVFVMDELADQADSLTSLERAAQSTPRVPVPQPKKVKVKADISMDDVF